MPLRLVLDSDGVRDAVHVVEVRDDLDGVVHGRVAPSLCPEHIDVGRPHCGRLVRHLDGEVAERADRGLEIGAPIVVGGVLCQLFRGALVTEVVRVRAYSVMAVVGAGDDYREKLPLGPGQLGGAEHDLLVQVHRAPQDGRSQAHGLDDVEDLACPPDSIVVLSLEVAGRLAHVYQA